MISYPSDEEVLDDLGDKVADGLREAVEAAAEDLKTYRGLRPDWVAEHTERGLANWIHDRLWQHLVRMLGEHPLVELHDKEPTREITFGTKYRMRAKRQSPEGFINNYPTQSALEFEIQFPALPGLEEIRLYCGYSWESLERQIGSAVLSLHDGQDHVVWVSELLDRRLGNGRVRPIVPTGEGPKPPVIEMPGHDARRDKGSGTDSE
jgi:hypothetical protein